MKSTLLLALLAIIALSFAAGCKAPPAPGNDSTNKLEKKAGTGDE